MDTDAGYEQEAPRSPSLLGPFLEDHLETILSEWEEEIRRLPIARDLSQPILRDSAHDFLSSIVRSLSRGGAEVEAHVHHLIEGHALQRLGIGFSLAQAISEYTTMRDVVLRLWNEDHDRAPPIEETRVFHRTMDKAIEMAIAYFTGAQERAAIAIDRISMASFESRDLDDLLARLVHAVLESLPAVDTVSLLMREGETLRVRVAEGLGREVELGFEVPIGKGFAGTIAATKEPVLLKDAWKGPLLRSPHLRARHVRALYGVPLVAEGHVIGVAHIGSLSASEFSGSDVRILDALATRATAAIYQRMLKQEADRRAAELAAVIESMPDAVFIASPSRLEQTNRRGIELLGLDSDDQLHELHTLRIARLGIRDLATGEPLVESAFGDAFRGRSSIREVVIRRPDGQERIIRYSTAPVRSGGDIELAVAIATDVTERKAYERERAELLVREQEARKRAEKAVRIREHVLAIVSHDLRNPLGAARMSAELIFRRARELGDSRLVRHAETIRRSSDRMDHLIADLVDVAGIEAGGLKVVATGDDATSLLEEAVLLQEPLATEKGIRLVLEDESGRAPLRIDRARMLQVFSNLVGNALKYSDPGTSVRLRAARGEGRVRFQVADEGPGIPDDELAHVFDPYWTRERKGQVGTGLGLVIAKAIVEAHGGTISAESEAGRGTNFSFDLPLDG